MPVSPTLQPNGGLWAAIATRLRQAGDRTIIDQDGRALSGQALLQQVQQHANALHALGVRHGDRIAVHAEKSVAQCLLYLATLQLGAVYVPLNTGYVATELGYFLNDAKPTLLICGGNQASVLTPLAEAIGARLHTLDADGGGSWSAFTAQTHASATSAQVTQSDLAALIYTSGTTGRPKGAMITHGNLTSNAQALIHAWQITSADVLLHALPLYHIHGLFVALNTLLLAGGRIQLLSAFDSARVVQDLTHATLFMGVPTYYTRLLTEPHLSKETARHIRLFVCGSAPLLAQTFIEFESRTGHRVLERYGMSECGIISTNPYAGDRIAGCVGLPLPHTDCRIVDTDGTALPTGTTGGIEVRGPGVCAGYWRNPEKTATDWRADGFFITGDLGMLDARGYLTIVGRAKDLIISGGLNVYPKEIECVLDTLPGVSESAVFGVPHPDFGEAVIAAISACEGAMPDPAELIAATRTQLAAFKTPKAIFVLQALPRNTMGKVQKALLRERYAATFTQPS